MADAATRAALTAEKARTYWDYQVRQLEMAERRYLQLLAVTLGAGLAVLASVLLERVPAGQGMLLAGALFLGAIYVEVKIARLPVNLRRAFYAAAIYNNKLMNREDP